MNISKISRFIIFLKRNLTLTAQAGQRKSSTNKNIKKLRTICMVSTLTFQLATLGVRGQGQAGQGAFRLGS